MKYGRSVWVSGSNTVGFASDRQTKEVDSDTNGVRIPCRGRTRL